MTLTEYHSICDHLRRIIRGTEWEGHVFAVGGCCRDEVMGREINDVDLAVDLQDGGVRFARWLDRHGRCASRPVYFERYGTAMLQLRAFRDHEIEIVQTRKGKYTADNAHNPGSVFGTIEDDGLRRDLTVNALFYDITRRALLDPTGRALDDIEARRLQTPMDAALTFFDDPSRILRVIRMAASWGWDIDEPMLQAMREGRSGLADIKVERRRGELEKMLRSADPVRAMRLVRTVGVMQYLLPELELTYKARSRSNTTLWTLALHTLANVRGSDSLSLRLACLLYTLAETPRVAGKTPAEEKPSRNGRTNAIDRALRAAYIAEKMLRRLHAHSHFTREVAFLIRNQACSLRWGDDGRRASDRMLVRLANLCATPRRLENLLTFLDAINLARFPANAPQRTQIPTARNRMKALKLL